MQHSFAFCRFVVVDKPVCNAVGNLFAAKSHVVLHVKMLNLRQIERHVFTFAFVCVGFSHVSKIRTNAVKKAAFVRCKF